MKYLDIMQGKFLGSATKESDPRTVLRGGATSDSFKERIRGMRGMTTGNGGQCWRIEYVYDSTLVEDVPKHTPKHTPPFALTAAATVPHPIATETKSDPMNVSYY